jgi:hypothetical protein
MSVQITKPITNVREELNDARKPSGIAGEAMLRAETPQDQQALVGVGRKNIMINGANLINQRGTVSGINTATLNYGGPDRRNLYVNHPGESVFEITQGSSGPTGFPKTCRINCTTAGVALTTSQEIKTEIPIEGYDLQQVGYGTPQCKHLTISFWVKSNQAANYILWLYRPDGTRHTSKVYTINNPNTWEFKTITYNPDVSDPVDADDSTGLYVSFILNSGPTYSNGTSPNGAWQDIVSGNRYAGLTATIGSSTNDYFEFTGLQVETGEVATPFEHRSYGEELALCQRYFYRVANGASQSLGLGVNYTSTYMMGNIYFPVTMRTAPTLHAASGTNYYEFIRGGGADFFNSLSLGNRTTDKIGEIYNNTEISGTVGLGGYIRTDNSAVFVDFDAELL